MDVTTTNTATGSGDIADYGIAEYDPSLTAEENARLNGLDLGEYLKRVGLYNADVMAFWRLTHGMMMVGGRVDGLTMRQYMDLHRREVVPTG